MLVIGSRGSRLALWQANYVKARIEALGHPCRIEVITTTGDRFQSGPLKEIGNKGLFTKEIEEALMEARVDLAVHSLKDMPGTLPEGLVIAATPEREDPRDALVGARLGSLGGGARVGTGSLRRIAQLRSVRPDLIVEPIRGNVDTRLRKLDEGQFDAIVLAAAGLHRLGWGDRIDEYMDPEIMCPAAGQGSLAIETRGDGGFARQVCARLNHRETFLAITAERAALDVLGGGCQVPIGAHAQVTGDCLELTGVVIAPDGSTLVRRKMEGDAEAAQGIGAALGQELLDAGARHILDAVYSQP